MAKEREPEGGNQRPANEWMATFADLVTLLLTFFVLLLTMSSLDTKALKSSFGFFDGAVGVLARAHADLSFSKPTIANPVMSPSSFKASSSGVLGASAGDLAEFMEDQGEGRMFETRYILETGQGGGAEKVPEILRNNELLLRALTSGFELTLRPEFKKVLSILKQNSPDSVVEVEMVHGICA